jgi:hypothetical protein
VKRILQGIGHQCDGPFFVPVFYNESVNSVHRDIFGCYDLISFLEGKLIGHQVSTELHRGEKIKKLQEAGLPGWVWARFNNEDEGVGYEVYIVNGQEVIEAEMVYGLWKKPKCAGGPRCKGLEKSWGGPQTPEG